MSRSCDALSEVKPSGRLVFHRTTQGFEVCDCMPRHSGTELKFVYPWGCQRMNRGDAGHAIPPIFCIDGHKFVGAVLSWTSRGVRGHAAA